MSATLRGNDIMPATLKEYRKPIRVIPDFDAFAASHPWIGQKIGKVQDFPGGFAQEFQTATAYARWAGDPNEVHGAIRDKYVQLNGPEGFLGFPTTNELTTPDGAGRYNHFEGGSIYWTPQTGAHEVHGLIRDKWAALGWEQSFLGYPVSDELDDGSGERISIFQWGYLEWAPGREVVVRRSLLSTPLEDTNH
jgi:hypothetical protein